MLSSRVGMACAVMPVPRRLRVIDGQALADGLVEGQRSPGDMVSPAADHDAVGMAMTHRPRRRSPADGWGRCDIVAGLPGPDALATRRPSSRMRITIRQLMHFDDTPGPIGNAVVIAADRDQPVMTDAPLELEQRIEAGRGQGLQFGPLGSEGFRDDPLGRAMQPDIGDA